MTFLKSIWKQWSALIVLGLTVGALSLWVHLAEEKRALERSKIEEKIQKQAEAKKIKEEDLQKKYMAAWTQKNCNIDYSITLEAFSPDTKVELRSGELGNSFSLGIRAAKEGKVGFTSLCPGSFFIAVGNEMDISLGPVQEFSKGKIYNSKVHMTRDLGNMKTMRRELL